jgi:hypothetical protein
MIRDKKNRRFNHIKNMYMNNADSIPVTYMINGDIDVNHGSGHFSGSLIDDVDGTLGDWKDAYDKFEHAIYDHLTNMDIFDYDVNVRFGDNYSHKHGINMDCYGDDYRADWKADARKKISRDAAYDHMRNNW